MNKGYVYRYNIETHCVTVEGLSHFNADHTFLCGQCFRWNKLDDGSFTGVAMGKAVNIRHIGNTLVITNCSEEEFVNIWVPYLDLDTDYGAIKETLSADEHLRKATEYGNGIHLLNQEPFECLISYIISAQNNIPRIKKIIDILCRMYGDEIRLGEEVLYTFPDCNRLAVLEAEELAPLNAGYRAPYIIDASRKVASGEIKLNALFDLPTDVAKTELLRIKGVGPKVADCTLLFSLGKRDAFPVDVWMQKIMRTLYLGDNATLKEIRDFGTGKFGNLSGIAQQYLFYYARENM